MQLPLMRSSAESTAAVTKLANAMFVMKRPRLSTCSTGVLALAPLGHAHLAAEQARLDADVRDRLGEAERAAPRAPVVARARAARRGPGTSSRCSGVPRSWMGATASTCARLQVAAPASTHASSNATSASAKFFGPRMNPPCSGSRNIAVRPASSKARSRPAFSSVHSCELRAPVGDQAGDRPARHRPRRLHEHLEVVAVAEPPHQLSHAVVGKRADGVCLGSCLSTHRADSIPPVAKAQRAPARARLDGPCPPRAPPLRPLPADDRRGAHAVVRGVRTPAPGPGERRRPGTSAARCRSLQFANATARVGPRREDALLVAWRSPGPRPAPSASSAGATAEGSARRMMVVR